MAQDRGPQVQAVACLFLGLAWIAVSLRCYVRTVMMKSFGVDDWLAVASLVLFTLYCTFVLKGVQYGTGQHLADLPPTNIPIALKWWWCCELAYVSSTTVLKASICMFLKRICVKRSQTLTIWAVLTSVSVFSVFYIFLIIFQCRPSDYFWTRFLGASGTCLPTKIITDSTYAHSALSAVTDWTLGILPIFLVWNLAMNPRTKVSVAIILALGALGSTATVVRIPYIGQLSDPDFLWATTDVAIWSTVEPGIGITAAAMATLRPLFRSFLSRSKMMGSSTNQQSGSDLWPSKKRSGYQRSGSGRKDEASILGLRSDIGKGVGVTTVIHSAGADALDLEMGKRERTSSEGTLEASGSRIHLKDDSSEEFLPMQLPKKDTAWGVRKTMEVSTSQEIQIGHAA